MLFVDVESIKVFWDSFVEEESYFSCILLNNCFIVIIFFITFTLIVCLIPFVQFVMFYYLCHFLSRTLMRQYGFRIKTMQLTPVILFLPHSQQ